LPSASSRNLHLALKDLKEGLGAVYIWSRLGWLDIKQRYRRSVLGPFWLTISAGILILAMGPLYGRLFNLKLSEYVPYLAVSYVLWVFIAGLTNDACTTFISAENYIKQVRLPFTVYVMRVVWKNFLMFLHNLVIVLAVLLFLLSRIDWSALLAPFGLLLILVNGVWFGLLLGLLCARYRDIQPIVASLIQIAFFLTPILWKPGMLGRHRWAADWNPLFHFLEIVRGPLLGESFAASSWVIVLLVTAGGSLVTLALFARYRNRIAYWV
jgi:ABC-type polysaccharide/polyol phosphate export permease